MKISKIILLVFSVSVLLSLAGCQDMNVSSVQENTIASVTVTPTITPQNAPIKPAETDETMQDYSKLFELKSYSDKTAYSTSDKIKIWATLKYVGSNTHITIWHGDPYISFYISDGKDFNIGGLVHDVLSSTELEKDKLYKFDYSKNGGYAAEDPKADFWKKFFSEKDLYLPEGEYTVKVGTAFNLTRGIEKNKSSLSDEFKIVVKSDPANDSTGKTPEAALIQFNTVSYNNQGFEDLDGDAHPDDICLMLLENSQDSQWYDISIKINDTEYSIPKYCTNPVSPDQETNLQTLQSADHSKYIMLSASFPINGSVTDGDYHAYMFLYSRKKIDLIWDGTFPHSQSDFQYIIDTDKFTLELPFYAISYMKKFTSDSKYKWIMAERKEREKAGKSISSIFLSMQEIENLGIQDYNDDGFKEIITQNSIFLEDSHIYIGSLYTLYRPDDSMNRPDKIFMLDRYGISSRIIKEIIDKGYIKKGSWGSTLTYWVETKQNNYTEKDIEKCLSELVDQNILVSENDTYRLLLK